MYPSAGINAAAVAAAAAARHPVSKPFVSSILRTSFLIVRLFAFKFPYVRVCVFQSVCVRTLPLFVVPFCASKIILSTE